MRRKTKCRVNRFKFTAKALNLSSRNAIIEKAEQQQIKVRKQSQPKLRLNFSCSKEKWLRFYREIKALCVDESPVMCRCPQWLQRRITKNLRMTVRNGKVNATRAYCASIILARLNK